MAYTRTIASLGAGTPYAGGQRQLGSVAPSLGQPVMGSPAPAGGTGTTQQTASTTTGGGTGGSSFSSPSPNPYNLPDDLVQGQSQGDQFGGLLNQFEQARTDAKTANESRYQQAIEGYQQLDQDYAARTQQGMQELEGYGEGYRQDLQDRFAQQGAGLTQDMINRGLYNSTSLDQARQGLSRQQQRQSLTLEDMLTRQRMDYGARLSGEELQNRPRLLEAIERRNDIGPSLQDVAGVSGAVGQSQAGVPDYLSALGGEGTARSGGGGTLSPGGGGSGLTAPQLTRYRTPSTQYSITSRGGSGVANPLSLGGSRRSSGSRTGSSGGSGGSGAGGSGEFDRQFPRGGDGGMSGGETNRQVQGGQGSGKAVTIVVNEDGSYFDATNGQSYATYEELMQDRRNRQDTRGQDPATTGQDPGGAPTPADPSTRPPEPPQNEEQAQEQSVLTDPDGNQLKDPQGNDISLEGQGDPKSWYMGKPPIYWSYFYGNVPGIGIMAGQTIAAGIAAAMRRSGMFS